MCRTHIVSVICRNYAYIIYQLLAPIPATTMSSSYLLFAALALATASRIAAAPRPPHPGTNIIDVSSLQSSFGANSALDDHHPEMWVEQAAMLIPVLTDVVRERGVLAPIIKTSDFTTEAARPITAALRTALHRQGSDKAQGVHRYPPIYGEIIKRLGGEMSKLRTLEIGMGTNNVDVVSNMGLKGSPGASLYAFESVLPNSEIFGADFDSRILFEKGRIKTHFVNQLNRSSFSDMYQAFGSKPFDLIIDDGLHSLVANINTLLSVFGYIKRPGYIVIEDVLGAVTDGLLVFDALIGPKAHEQKFKTYMIETAGATGAKGHRTCVYVVEFL